MSKPALTIIMILVLAVFVLYSASYTVQESEQVVIVRFGEVIGDAVIEPGLHFKIPVIDNANRFEKRWLEWDGDANQITTRDKRYIYIDVFARWRISNPLVFIASLRDERSAQGRLDDIIDNATRNVIANHNLIEVIRSTNRKFEEADEEARLTGQIPEDDIAKDLPVAPDPKDRPTDENKDEDNPTVIESDAGLSDEKDKTPLPDQPSPPKTADVEPDNAAKLQALYATKFGRGKLTRVILEKASKKASQLGIELKDVQIKRIDYIESVQAKVFDRMISERKRVAEAFRSQGQGRSAEILGQTDKELKKIQSGAYRTAQEIMGRADAEAAAIYANAYRSDPEFYNFLKTLESYRETIDESSWLLLSTDADYARHLKTMKKAVR
ncbi:MAG: protease modulator HflC [Proteobacteria bacterium]|nr:protease modulator HflC [Pseudomonadota bacterium]